MVAIKNLNLVPVDCTRFRHRFSKLSFEITKPYDAVPYDKLDKYKNLGCSNSLSLDQGYRVFSVEKSSLTGNYSHPLITFISIYNFPKPDWAKDIDENELYENWRPSRLRPAFKTNYGYTKLTNWYSYHLIKLKLLDYFDYVGKLDTDVSFISSFPSRNLPLLLAKHHAKVLVTQKDYYDDAPQVSQGVFNCLYSYLDIINSNCNLDTKYRYEFQPSGYVSHEIFWRGNTMLKTTFRAHFTIFWLGLYSSPEVHSMAKYWNSFHPDGIFRINEVLTSSFLIIYLFIGQWAYRWGDQQYWPRPMSMFSSASHLDDVYHYNELDTENNSVYLVHKLYPLSFTLREVNYFVVNGSNKEERLAKYRIAKKKYNRR